ncbi:hypothetical protein B0H17DRAFT_430746 [Mycena rosella]|uniref:Uncharacterized protein n=1 Tax=Mycena rosella TaxID=1033263 RepID=A0AAD7GMY2_MYCRO|nr:hypothetical protein B0H17DRAFT_430746 [Mycena rosella]
MVHDIRALLEFSGHSENEVISESEAVAALILSAINDENPSVSLDQVYSALCQSRSESHLDPLGTLPYLLLCPQPAAKSLIALVGECGSPKEVVIAVQEILERVGIALDGDEEDDPKPTNESPSDQLISLILLYNAAIPRLKLRKKPPSETIRPLLSQLESTINLAGSRLNRDQGREIIRTVSQLSLNSLSWATKLDSADAGACREILWSLLDTAISACSHCIQSSLAQRSFEALFPRLTIRSTVPPGWENGETAVNEALAVYSAFGRTFALDSLPPLPSTTYLILLSHSKFLPSDIGRLMSFMLPILIASIQANSALDETLSLLLQTLHPSHFPASQQLPPDISGPLCALLPSLASAHPDADLRHQAFRILSRVLALTPPDLRLQILKDLTTDADFPQMRVAAVGLVKEASLQFLAEGTPSIFASPIFLQVLGPVLLRPDPPDLFHPDLSLADIEDSSEPARLVECLSLYYILLLRDTANRTGIRDRDQISNVEKTLLAPLRSTLARWMDDGTVSSGQHMHAIMPLVSLKTSLERVDAAVADLGSTASG